MQEELDARIAARRERETKTVARIFAVLGKDPTAESTRNLRTVIRFSAIEESHHAESERQNLRDNLLLGAHLEALGLLVDIKRDSHSTEYTISHGTSHVRGTGSTLGMAQLDWLKNTVKVLEDSIGSIADTTRKAVNARAIRDLSTEFDTAQILGVSIDKQECKDGEHSLLVRVKWWRDDLDEEQGNDDALYTVTLSTDVDVFGPEW